jgi:hypothetical protein
MGHTPHVAPDGHPFQEAPRHAASRWRVQARWLAAGNRLISVCGSALRLQQRRQFGDATEHGTRSSWFTEASIQGVDGR